MNDDFFNQLIGYLIGSQNYESTKKKHSRKYRNVFKEVYSFEKIDGIDYYVWTTSRYPKFVRFKKDLKSDKLNIVTLEYGVEKEYDDSKSYCSNVEFRAKERIENDWKILYFLSKGLNSKKRSNRFWASVLDGNMFSVMRALEFDWCCVFGKIYIGVTVFITIPMVLIKLVLELFNTFIND